MKSAGFTLVEMLVALLVFSLVSAAGVGVMAYAADHRDTVRQRMAEVGELQRARALLKADLSQAAPRRVRRADGSVERQAFVGAAGRAQGRLFAFTRRGWANPAADARASLQYVEYALIEGRLERRTRFALDGAPLREPQVLLRGVRGAEVHYRYRGQWIDGWPGGVDAVPEALRLDLDLEGIGPLSQWFLMPGQWP